MVLILARQGLSGLGAGDGGLGLGQIGQQAGEREDTRRT